MAVVPLHIYKFERSGSVHGLDYEAALDSAVKHLNTIYIDDETGQVVERRFISSLSSVSCVGWTVDELGFDPEYYWWEVMPNGDRHKLSDEELAELRAQKGGTNEQGQDCGGGTEVPHHDGGQRA